MAEVDGAIEDFLGRPCTLPGSDKVTWGGWISSVMFDLYADDIGSKRPNCDSSWGFALEEAMCLVDPEVCDADIYAQYLLAHDEGNWELADELSQALIVNVARASAAWRRVCEYITRPRG